MLTIGWAKSQKVCYSKRKTYAAAKTGGGKENSMIFERTVVELAGDYAVLQSESGTRTEVALALLPDGIREGTVLICENFEYRVKTL